MKQMTKFPLDPLKEDGDVFDESDDLRKNTFARLLRLTNTDSASGTARHSSTGSSPKKWLLQASSAPSTLVASGGL